MKVLFMGTPDIAVPSLAAIHGVHSVLLAVTQPDRPRGRGRHSAPPAVKVHALRAGIACWQPAGLDSPGALEKLGSCGADIIVVVAYGMKLPDPVLDLAPQGAVNLHFSLLPAYRGAAPVNWPLIEGRKETGLTTFRLTSRMDAGPVYMRKRLSIQDGETAGELAGRLAQAGAGLLLETLEGIAGGTLTPSPQEEGGASRAPKLRKTDGLIDWSRPAGQIVNLIRGVNPWPGAFTELAGGRLKIWRAVVAESAELDKGAPPGTILAASPRRGLIVAGGEGAVSLTEIQPEGKRRMTARDFLTGHRLRRGARIGL